MAHSFWLTSVDWALRILGDTSFKQIVFRGQNIVTGFPYKHDHCPTSFDLPNRLPQVGIPEWHGATCYFHLYSHVIHMIRTFD